MNFYKLKTSSEAGFTSATIKLTTIVTMSSLTAGLGDLNHGDLNHGLNRMIFWPKKII